MTSSAERHPLDDGEEITTPDTPGALLARTIEHLRGATDGICIAVPLLERLVDSEREYFAMLLAEDIDEIAQAYHDLASYVRSRARQS